MAACLPQAQIAAVYIIAEAGAEGGDGSDFLTIRSRIADSDTTQGYAAIGSNGVWALARAFNAEMILLSN